MADEIDNSNISVGSGHDMQLDNEPLILERLRMPKSTQEKYKATSFPIMSLKIGSWEKRSSYEGEMEAKCYYSTKKIVWEVLENDLKSKIEIQFSDIEAMRGSMIENQPGTLELLLNKSPLFYRERDPVPKKQTVWYNSFDFTQGQASTVRTHNVMFPPGALDKNYEMLLQSDSRFMDISKEIFPVKPFPYFQTNNSNTTNIQLDYDNLNTSNIQFGYGSLSQSQPTLAMSYPLPQMFTTQYDQPNYNLNAPLPQFAPEYDQTNYNLHAPFPQFAPEYDQTNYNLHAMHPNSIQMHDPPSQNEGINYQQSNTKILRNMEQYLFGDESHPHNE